MNDQSQHLTQEQWLAFRDRVAEAAGISRAAATNIVTALSSITVAIVGAAVTLGTADYKNDTIAVAMLLAIAGAGLAAVIIVLTLAAEALRAARWAARWHRLYQESFDAFHSNKPISALPLEELRKARLSVSIHWKVSLPIAFFLLGLLAAAGMLAASKVRWAPVPAPMLSSSSPLSGG